MAALIGLLPLLLRPVLHSCDRKRIGAQPVISPAWRSAHTNGSCCNAHPGPPLTLRTRSARFDQAQGMSTAMPDTADKELLLRSRYLRLAGHQEPAVAHEPLSGALQALLDRFRYSSSLMPLGQEAGMASGGKCKFIEHVANHLHVAACRHDLRPKPAVLVLLAACTWNTCPPPPSSPANHTWLPPDRSRYCSRPRACQLGHAEAEPRNQLEPAKSMTRAKLQAPHEFGSSPVMGARQHIYVLYKQ